MKAFGLATLIATTAHAAKTRSFVEGAGQNGTSGQFVVVNDGSINETILTSSDL